MKDKLLLLDNNDSFVYNLYQYLFESFKGHISVIKNNAISLKEVNEFDIIVLSPGPDLPEKAGIMVKLIKEYFPFKPILGVCLGHQAIYEAFGGTLKNLETVHHGIKSDIVFDNTHDPLFHGLPDNISVGSYHSWVADETTLPDELLITARDIDGEIMAITHKQLPVKGVQFHPESYMSQEGRHIIRNFLTLAKA